MRQANKRIPESAEKTVRDIRRATRRHHSAEEKIRIVLKACAARTALLSCAARKGSIRTCTTVGQRSSWRRARNGSPATRGILDCFCYGPDGLAQLLLSCSLVVT